MRTRRRYSFSATEQMISETATLKILFYSVPGGVNEWILNGHLYSSFGSETQSRSTLTTERTHYHRGF